MESTILFIEDDSDDVFLIQRACRTAAINEQKHFLGNGRAAVDFLSKATAEDRSQKLPRLIFLDLNMPLMGGLEFLKWLRQQPVLQWIPVVVLTTSENPQDISAAYQFGANAYIIKPTDTSQFADMLNHARHFWLFYNRWQTN